MLMGELKGTSSEIQSLALVGLLHDQYLLSKCIDAISPKFFDNGNYKVIYKCLQDFYRKNQKIPTIVEINAELEKVVNLDVANVLRLDLLKQDCINLYSQSISSEDYVYAQVTEFIRRNRIEDSLGKVMSHIENGKINLDDIAVDLQQSLSLNFEKLPIINLADSNVEHLREIRTDALGTSDNPVSVKFFIEAINDCMQYKSQIPGTLTMVTASPGSGKTTLLINQGLYTASTNLNVLHIFLGDMSQYDGVLRYVSCFTGKDTSTLTEMSEYQLSELIQKCNVSGVLKRIDIASYAADQLSVTQLIEEIIAAQKKCKKHYHLIIIDYDENLCQEADNTYASGGQIYNKIALFAVLNKSVVFIASQPKPEYWKYEILPMEAASESSKKQKIIDMMITMGKPSRNSSVATLHIAKNRRGRTGLSYRVSINGNTAKITHITEEEYVSIKQAESRN